MLAAAGAWSSPVRVAGDSTEDSRIHVYPGQEIQEALDRVASEGLAREVVVHSGTYRPQRSGQALIWFNERHDGIVLEAVGEVVLTAANPELADPDADSFPAVVNHVVYFGDGISERTVLRGFKITGANNFVDRSEGEGSIERKFEEPELQRALFFYTDGGGIKIFGRSYPTLEDLEIYDNYASPCGGGISIEHRGFNQRAVRVENTILRDNRAQVTGSAIDLLPGSSAIIENSLFIGNISNTGEDEISPKGREYMGESGSGALTVFEGSRVLVDRSTFTGNWNGVDDLSSQSNLYLDSIFWMNSAQGGVSKGPRYELYLLNGDGVRNCWIQGQMADGLGTIDRSRNRFGAPDPGFDSNYRPMATAYGEVGYRPRSATAVAGTAGADRDPSN